MKNSCFFFHYFSCCLHRDGIRHVLVSAPQCCLTADQEAVLWEEVTGCGHVTLTPHYVNREMGRKGSSTSPLENGADPIRHPRLPETRKPCPNQQRNYLGLCQCQHSHICRSGARAYCTCEIQSGKSSRVAVTERKYHVTY